MTLRPMAKRAGAEQGRRVLQVGVAAEEVLVRS
jgi:hypothetical protein